MNGKGFDRKTELLKTVNVKCTCGHSINITNRYKRLICKWCGKMVYLDKNEQKKNDFKNKLRSIINENNKNGNSTF